MSAGAAVGAICAALLLDFSAGPAGHPASAPDAAVLAATPGLDPAPTSGVPGPGVPALGLAHRSAQADRTAAAALRSEALRPAPQARGVIDHDPRLADAGGARVLMDPEVAERAETALDLSRRQRRELQRRLALAEHDPRFVDGIFGPATRAAITGWQISAGLPPTGYLDGQAVALLKRQTDDRYRAWQVAHEGDRRQRTRTAAMTSPLPPATPVSADKCQRLWTGEIAYGQNMSCDFRGLRENVAQLFRVAERS